MQLRLRDASSEATAWDFREQALIGCGAGVVRPCSHPQSSISNGVSTHA